LIRIAAINRKCIVKSSSLGWNKPDRRHLLLAAGSWEEPVEALGRMISRHGIDLWRLISQMQTQKLEFRLLLRQQ